MKRRIVLLGPPASGKGTQAVMLSKRFQLPSASTGAILRHERALGTDLGREADRWTRDGKLFPDETAMRVVRSWLDRDRWDAFILDGFPRTVGQARAFDADLAERGLPLDAAIHLDLDADSIRARVGDRLTCPDCGATFSAQLHALAPGDPCPACAALLVRRSDDSPEVLDERLAQHHQFSEPVIAYYRSTGKLVDLDAASGSESVFQQLERIVGEEVPA